MFDLNVAIENWRAALKAQPNFVETDLEELEDHLWQEIGALEESGLTSEESYLIASRRLGNPEDLNGEFAIADPKQRRSFRLSWMITGALALVFLWLMVHVLITLAAMALDMTFDPRVSFQGQVGLGGLMGMLRLILLILGGYFIWRLLTSDRTAHKLNKMSGWTVVVGALLLFAMLQIMRFGPFAFLHGGDSTQDLITLTMIFPFVIRVAFPVLLLYGLWRLVRS